VPQAVSFAAVIGKGARCPEHLWHHARWTGLDLATLHPHVAMVCGGLRGVMEGAAAGMTEGGGVAIGLVPNGLHPNRYLSYAIRTGLPVAYRDIMTAATADIMIVLPGSHGTCIEAWAGAERKIPLIATGDHAGWPTEHLPFTEHAEPPHIAALVAKRLRLPG
jgi:uncharacterized protein (TIGR00725 family)